MPIVPDTRLGKLEFYEEHLPPWMEHTAAIGLDPALVTALSARAAATRAAYEAHRRAQEAARAAAQRYFALVGELHGAPGAGSDMIDMIKNHAQTRDDPGVYALAQLPPPATPTTPPPPGTPSKFSVRLLENGAIDLRWKCQNPSGTRGTMYEILRSERGGPMAFVASVGTKRFVDRTIPEQAGPLTYQITALRSTSRGKPARVTIRFGEAGNNKKADETSVGLAA